MSKRLDDTSALAALPVFQPDDRFVQRSPDILGSLWPMEPRPETVMTRARDYLARTRTT